MTSYVIPILFAKPKKKEKNPKKMKELLNE